MKKIYQPSFLDENNKPISLVSAWVGLEKIIKPIVKDFNLNTNSALEIGVDYGYSLSALSNVFEEVVGVDTFCGDVHAGTRDESQYQIVLKNFSEVNNVQLIKSSYQEYFESLDKQKHFDLIHVDIVHTFQETYDCGKLSLEHSNCVIFHDTESFSDVNKACGQLSVDFECEFFNYPYSHGLGILVKR